MMNVLAGELVIETELAVDLFVDGRPAAKLYGPGVLQLELPDGDHDLTVYRGNGGEQLPVTVGTEPTRVRIGSTLLEASAAPTVETPVDATTGNVEMRLVDGPAVTLIWEGEQHPIPRGGTLIFSDLEPGEYRLEARSADLTYVWMRGTVRVEAGDQVVMALSEGHPAECFGRPEAWQPDR